MTENEIAVFFATKTVGDEYLKFDRIPTAERLHQNRQLCGLLKVAELMKDQSDWDMCAVHDEVFLAHVNELREDLTEADIIYLHRCGVRYDSGQDCLAMFA